MFAAQLKQAESGNLLSNALLDRIRNKEGRRRNSDVANPIDDAIKVLMHVSAEHDPQVHAG